MTARALPGTARSVSRRGSAGAVLALLLSACVFGAEADDSPFGEIPPYGWSTGSAEQETFTDGIVILRNKSKMPITLRAVAFEDGEPGLVLTGVLVAGVDRPRALTQRMPGFPPTDPAVGRARPLSGFVLPPGGDYATLGVELLMGVRRSAAERATRTAVLVTYEIDGQRGITRVPATLAVCEKEQSFTCPQEDGKD